MTTFKRLLLLVPFALLLVPSNAFAETSGPQWTVSSVSQPTNFAVGASEDSYLVFVTNTGGAAADCTEAQYVKEEEEEKHLISEHHGHEAKEPVCPKDSPVVNSVTIVDEVPAGLEAAPGVTAEDLLASQTGGGGNFSKGCADTGSGAVSCTYSGFVQPDDTLILRFPVKVVREKLPSAPFLSAAWPAGCEGAPAGALSCVSNVVRVSGGGASAAAEVDTPTRISENAAQAKAETVFGLAPGGESTVLSTLQAGAHPDLTTTGAFDTENAGGVTPGDAKNITDDLPAGFAGDLVDTPACQPQLFLEEECPSPTQIGVTTQIFYTTAGAPTRDLKPLYNLAPEPGEVAKIGFYIGQFRYIGDISVRSPGERGPAGELLEPYGLKAIFYSVSSGGIDYNGFSLTIWGDPASAIHNALRWKVSTLRGSGSSGPGSGWGVSSSAIEAPYFTNPTTCTSEPLHAELKVTSYQHPNESESPPPIEMGFGPLVGCDRLLMEPVLTAQVTSDAAYSATGFDLDTSIPQTYDNANGLATSTLKQEVVTLPEGMTVNPSSGAGLSACSEAQYAEELAPEKTAQEKAEGKGCPNSSKLATVRIKTPSIAEEVTGSAYLATPYDNPFPEPEKGHPNGSLLALYLVARAANRGVLVKAPGLVQPNPETGRLTTTFGPTPAFGGLPASPGLPPLPASDISFEFNQGANAPLVTPPTCGNYTVTAQLTPWATPENVLDPSIPPFPIDANCPAGNVPPFHPGVTAYPIHGNAGAYSPLYIKISRNDGEQEITGFSSQFPAGLTGNLSGVTQCGEAEVQRARAQTGVEAEASPACPQNSEIGYSIAEAGVGGVLAQTPGKIYLGGPYDGAPFSVVSVTAAHVGPFDLGTVVVHFPLDINPETAVVTIPASPSDVIPHIIKGIVVHLRDIRVYVNRPNFMLNPTSCPEQKLSATVLGNGPVNNSVTVSDPFQTADCSSLKFEPKFQVSTSGKTSKANGASLKVKLTYPANALGIDSNIKQVKVELPKQLPSRLTTLQKACTQTQFKANPAGCPAPSLIGTAKAITPILPVPLEGPVYFVSNGGEAFPNLIMVLQGDGVTIDLVGDTFISKSGVTSSTFKAVPDQPVSSFELELPEKQYSALAANGSLCKPTKTVTVKRKVKVKRHGKAVRRRGKVVKVTRKVKEQVAASLQMPTEFVGQNGAVVKQTTAVSVTGCAKVKPAKKAKVKKKKAKSKPRKKKK